MEKSKEYAKEIAWIVEYFKEHPNASPFGLRLNIDRYPEEQKQIVTSPQFPDFRAEIPWKSDSYYAFCEWLRGSGLMETYPTSSPT